MPADNPADLPSHLAEVVAALPPHIAVLAGKLPQRLMDVLGNSPVYADRRTGADLLTRHIMPVSHRSLEAWPLPWQHANGKALCPMIALFAVGWSMLSTAPVRMGGRGKYAVQQQEAA